MCRNGKVYSVDARAALARHTEEGLRLEETSHKYDRIVAYIREQIETKQLGYGDRIPTENELIRRFSVSRFTVRKAVEQLAKQGMLEQRRGSGTFVKNVNSKKVRTNTVGILTTYMDDYIFPNIIRSIEGVLTQQGYSITLGITGNKVEKERLCLRSMLQHEVDGLIIEATKSALPNPNLDLLRQFSEKNIPAIFLHSRYDAFESSFVMMDDEHAGFLAGEHLIRCGHTKIAAVMKSDDMQGHRRYQGFLRSLYAHDLHLDESAVVWYTTEDMPDLLDGALDSVLLRRFSGSTAVLCYNDQIALKTIRLFERGGLSVPQDFSVMGFDDSDLCRLSSVKLTSVGQAQREEIGSIAAHGLLELIGGGKPIRRLLPPRLAVRDSVRTL